MCRYILIVQYLECVFCISSLVVVVHHFVPATIVSLSLKIKETTVKSLKTFGLVHLKKYMFLLIS